MEQIVEALIEIDKTLYVIGILLVIAMVFNIFK